jgi:hypothetical protein
MAARQRSQVGGDGFLNTAEDRLLVLEDANGLSGIGYDLSLGQG